MKASWITCERVCASACDRVAAHITTSSCTRAGHISAAASEGVHIPAEANTGARAGSGHVSTRAGEGVKVHGDRWEVDSAVRILDHEVGDLFPVNYREGFR